MSNIRLDQYGRVDTRGMTKEEYVDLLRKRKDKNNRVTVYRTERSVTRYILDYDNILHFEAMIRDTYDDYKFTFDDWKKKLLKKGTYKMVKMLNPIFENGKLVYNRRTVKESADYFNKELETLSEDNKRLVYPKKLYVDISDKLYDIKYKILEEHYK